MDKLLVIIYCGILLTACTSAPNQSSRNTSEKIDSQHVDLNNSNEVKQILNQQYNDWHQVQHRIGGLSKSGIDCSGLVYNTYQFKFGRDISRTAKKQSQAGRSIKKHQLRAGDLVFFKTGFKTYHVGIYIDKDNFLHVSSSKGVMISNLDDLYWSRAYWKARRLQ